MYNITLIPGDGVGPEITLATKKVLEATGIEINWEEVNAGLTTFEKCGELIPQELFHSLEKNKVALKGPITTPIGHGFKSINVTLRKKYNLFSNVRPIKSLGNVKTLFKNIDLIIFRENTEDLYAGIEKKINDNECHSIKVITREKSEKIAKEAFEYAKNQNRKSVTVVTKANIMKLTDGLFLESVRNIAKDYPNIELKEVLVDNMCMQLVINPYNYDVIVTENLYGDILSDLCAGLIGGLGLVPGANIGDEMAVFEAVHGSALDIAGKNIANPTAMILSGVMMLEYLGEKDKAKLIKDAINQVLMDENNFTADLGGKLSTEEFTNVLIEKINSLKGGESH